MPLQDLPPRVGQADADTRAAGILAPTHVGHAALVLPESPASLLGHPVREAARSLLLEAFPLIGWTTDRDLVLVSLEGAGLDPLGITSGNAVGLPLPDILSLPMFGPTDASIDAHRRALRGESVSADMVFAGRTYRSNIEPLRDDTGAIIGTVGAALDVTEGDAALRAAREHEARFRAVFDHADAGLVLIGVDGVLLEANRAFTEMLGLAPGSLGGRAWRSVVHPEDEDACAAQMRKMIEDGASSCRMPIRFRGADGGVVDTTAAGSLVRDAEGRPLYFVASIVDVTARRAAEAELMETLWRIRELDQDRRRLLRRVVTAQEEERRRLAAELHDDALQSLSASASMLESVVASSTGQSAALAARAREVTRRAVEHIRGLLFRLHPAAIEGSSLRTALRKLIAQNSSEPADPTITLELFLDVEPPPPTRVALFRIVQEALANARKHARAGEVRIVIRQQLNGILIRVFDDGVGFDAEVDGAGAADPEHLGLVAMRERAEMIGGWCRVYSRRGAGTEVESWLPAGGAIAADGARRTG